MSTGWEGTTKILATLALAAVGALSIGCGPAPGYEPEPRMPVGYAPVRDTSVEDYPQPATAAQLQAQAEARQAEANAQGEIALGADTTEYTDTDPSALTEFKPALDGHGAWVDDATYGTVWVPAEAEVGTDFVPYSTAGHWTYAEDTNYVWVSDYSWGWAPFHYGRWVHVHHHGWVWIPGRTYAGAWVVWRTGPGYDYVGWSPAGPDWYWYNGYAVGWTWGYTPYYSYCHRDYLYEPYIGRHVVYGNDPRARDYEARTRPYVAAAPSVGGNGRVAASPTVGGSGRVAASPTVGNAGGRVAASPHVGPRPAELGIPARTIVAPPADNAGLARAHAFASPSTAVALGATPPAGVVRRRVDQDAIATAPAPRGFDGRVDNRAPVVTNRFDAAARAPQVQGVAPVPAGRPSASTFDARSSSRSAFGASASPSVSAPSAPSATGPSYRSTPSFGSTPGYAQQQPAARMPSPPPPSFSQSTPSFRSAPSVSSPPPSFRSSPSFSQSTPSFRSAPSVSSPPPSFRSSPSYSAPAVRSAPAPARPSMPTRSAPTVRRR
jgi:hypothetical protein